ncbi:hypothetical protein [Nocardia cerradoensis]|uniref:Uncharacterized protein n=1 Tax=Nocardia cerradoensis TaxID=85688 RepID=A0A231GZY5_9NOCA|nr:hypothetical protein [Nocardia cerradoensis]OXR42061.1 hypothetical protein B7C42_05660 [Nocardia cerradoensis]
MKLYLLDVPENSGIVTVAAEDPALTVGRVGPYFEIRTDEAVIVIDRRATDCRIAVWYSAIAGLTDCVVTQHDKNALRLEPASCRP